MCIDFDSYRDMPSGISLKLCSEFRADGDIYSICVVAPYRRHPVAGYRISVRLKPPP
jgi:hypothetical protein